MARYVKLIVGRSEWKGPSKLILGVDIGTTYSGVTFLYLTEGKASLM